MIAHLVRADVRRVAPLLIAWVTLLAASTTLDGVVPQLAEPRAQEWFSIVIGLVRLAKLLLLVVVVPTVVQLHPLVGSDAFWMTRPIPPLTLLAAKLALLWPTVVILPTLAQALLMAVFGVTPTTMLLVSLSTLVTETLILSLLMAAAVLTASLARYALLWGGVLVAAAIALAIALAFAMAGPVNEVAEAPRLVDVDGTTGLLFTLVTMIAAAALLVVQYRRRSRVRAVVAGVVGVALAFAVETWWNVPLFAQPRPLPAWTGDRGSARVSADWTTVTVDPGMPMFDRAPTWRAVNAALDVETLPARWSGSPTLITGTLQVADGRILGSVGHRSRTGTMLTASAIGGLLPRGLHAALLQTLDVERFADQPDPPAQLSLLMRVANDHVPIREPAVGRYDGTFDVMLTEHELEGALPLQRGAVHHVGDYRLSVRDVQGVAGGLTVVVCESRASSQYTYPRPITHSVYLRNRARREAVSGYIDSPHGTLLLAGLFPNLSMGYVEYATGFTVGGRILRFPSPFRGRGDRLRLDAGWIAGAELVIVRSTTAGSIERRLEAESVTLPSDAMPLSSR